MATPSLPLPALSPPKTTILDSKHTRTLSRDSDADTASQKSISLSSPSDSPRNSIISDKDPRQSFVTTSSDSYSYIRRDSDAYSGIDDDVSRFDVAGGPAAVPYAPVASDTSASWGRDDSGDSRSIPLPTYPPTQKHHDDSASIASFASTSSRKARPESLVVSIPNGQLILGVALVDFNHLVGPRVEFWRGEVFEDEEVAKILPFLALPDGAHMSAEDYSYFHIVQPGPNPTTLFGISCNQQIAASELVNKPADVTRSTVQKAVVVLASKPVFGPIREKLRVVTTALFAQRDFSDYKILEDFGATLGFSLPSQLTESGLYMGTSLRELVHTFRQRTLVLVKALILQKRIMFYGYPVEKLCTFQYSLVSLLPGLLQNLDDCGSPPLATRASSLKKPNSLKTSDRKSMLAFMGLPLDIFGQDALFQPYLPLQQLDMLRNTPSWLCGCTNSIVTQQKEIDLLVHTDTGMFEFRDPQLERSAGLTAADRKWMDDIIRDVNEGWDEDDPTKPHGMKFKGSDDYLRSKFEEYINSALSTVKYRDFMAKGDASGVLITSDGNDMNAIEDFNPLWVSEFKKTRAYSVWERVTDSLLFDIVEPRHPCNEKPSVVADIGLRLQEGIQELKLDQQLAPAREAVARTFATGSTNLLKAVEGVRGRWARSASSSSTNIAPTDASRASTPPVEVSRSDLEGDEGPKTATQPSFIRPFSLSSKAFSLTSPGPASTSSAAATTPAPSEPASGAASPLSGWSANFNSFGSFFSEKASRMSLGTRQRSPSEDVQQQDQQKRSSASASAGGVAREGQVNGDAKHASTKSMSTFSTWSSLSALVSPPPAQSQHPQPMPPSPPPPMTQPPAQIPVEAPLPPTLTAEPVTISNPGADVKTQS
ncbi:hypothetical protein FA15DRAFT_705816 [Coprinopsis marcescibilis]|uniref:UDENN domain-containing protein n=1 Tax=Coprinopsis marcescibilis TaxID=230819 RepID=A0A5C3KRM6_COPMA|nr:hypothetical protein FA15DRAFT_705816 [Coprinopsis marcescibilis]